MKKASKKKPATKKKAAKPAKKPAKKKVAKTAKPAKSAKQKPAASTVQPVSDQGPIVKQPQVKQQAAVANGMFLYTDDAWSLRYFDQNDLHFKEREVFG
jgi:hypothetical protein